MSRVRIKVCGLTRRDELEAVCAAGVDAVGFVLSPSPRQLDPGSAMTLMQHLPPWVASVVVTRHPPADFGATVLSQLVPDWWQSDAGDFDGQQVPSGTRLLPVLRENEQQATTPPFYVYEGAQSGRGQTVDWQRAARQAGHGQMILAGGLDPDNVAGAIATVRPWAVDCSSGVESAPGRKDPQRIAAFVAAVTQASKGAGFADS